MQACGHDARGDRRICSHEGLRRLFAVGIEDHQSERLVEGFGGPTGKNDLPLLGRPGQILEMPSHGCAICVSPSALGTEPVNQPQDIEVRQNFSRAVPSPRVKVFG